MIDQESLPNMDDVQNQGQTEQELLDAVMANSPIMDEAAPPLPREELMQSDPEESEDQEETAEEESVSDYEEEVEEEVVEEAGEDDTSTQEPDLYTTDDLDLDAQVSLKIDGEEMNVSFGDLIKGYSTDQSLSKKGRELGEARKAIEEERVAKLDEIESVAQAASGLLLQSENAFANQYASIEKQIQEARNNGDTYEVNELKDKREQVQQRYWTARNRREDMMKAITDERQKKQQEDWENQLKNFSEQIPELIPDFNEDVALAIREFAIENDIPGELLDEVTNPAVVKFIDDYRRLKQGVSTGAKKRKAVPAKRAPVKKPVPQQQRKVQQERSIRDRAFSENATEADQDAFLRQYASRSLNL